MTILEACDDPKLFAPWFRKRETWVSWRAFMAALFGLPMSPAELEIFRACTGREAPPTRAFEEATLIVGRRGGKSFILALIAVYLSCFRDWRPYLSPGETGSVLVIATDRRQARVIFKYMKALIENVPMLAKMMLRPASTEEIELKNGVVLEIATASYRAVRGRTLLVGLLDEQAFWPTDDSANPDYEILDALRPAMATIPGAVLLCASSPYARRGALHDAYRRHYGRDDSDTLVWKAATKVMNPTIRQSVIDAAYERDAASARAEWGAEFRDDIESFIEREIVERLVTPGVAERPPERNVAYWAFVDPSGGQVDSFTLGIAHEAHGKIVLDALREVKAKFSPEAVAEEFAAVMKAYRITKCTGDRYAGSWPSDAFKRFGIQYLPSEKPKSALYVDLLPLLTSGSVVLLDHPTMINQLVGLERRTARGGRDSIDHAPNNHDDVANALAGVLAGRPFVAPAPFFGSYGQGWDSEPLNARHDPDWLAERGIYHPNDRARLIQRGIINADGTAKVAWKQR